MKFEVTFDDFHCQHGIKITNPTPEVLYFLLTTIRCDMIDDIRYKLRIQAGAFIQSLHRDFILIEFWKKDFQPLVDWLNKNFNEESVKKDIENVYGTSKDFIDYIL